MSVKSQGSPVIERVQVSRIITLTTSTVSSNQKVLLDSGVDANSMDKDLARELGLNLVLLERSGHFFG